jgi:hypothetical protein
MLPRRPSLCVWQLRYTCLYQSEVAPHNAPCRRYGGKLAHLWPAKAEETERSCLPRAQEDRYCSADSHFRRRTSNHSRQPVPADRSEDSGRQPGHTLCIHCHAVPPARQRFDPGSAGCRQLLCRSRLPGHECSHFLDELIQWLAFRLVFYRHCRDLTAVNFHQRSVVMREVKTIAFACEE